MIIYPASSWRNPFQPSVVTALREAGHDAYDFRNPRPGDSGFSWREVDPGWQDWDLHGWARGLEHPAAVRGYGLDMQALEDADLCVLILPAGRDASFEYGWHCGRNRRAGIVYQPAGTKVEPGLMYRGSLFVSGLPELVEAVAGYPGCLPPVDLEEDLVGRPESRFRLAEGEARRLLSAGLHDEASDVSREAGLFLCLRCGRGSRKPLWGAGCSTCPRCGEVAVAAGERRQAAALLAEEVSS